MFFEGKVPRSNDLDQGKVPIIFIFFGGKVIGPPPSTGNRLAPTLTGSLSPTGRATAVRCLLLFCLMGRRGPKTRTGNSLAPILTN